MKLNKIIFLPLVFLLYIKIYLQHILLILGTGTISEGTVDNRIICKNKSCIDICALSEPWNNSIQYHTIVMGRECHMHARS